MSKPVLKIIPLNEVTYEQFKKFLDSLDEERKTWSLDLQNNKNEKEFYKEYVLKLCGLVCLDDKKIISFCGIRDIQESPNIMEVSFVVKKEYQGNGIGTILLLEIENICKRYKSKCKYITAKHYKDNIASHKAFLKAKYEEWTIEKKLINSHGQSGYRKKETNDTGLDWKIKEIA